MKNVGKIFEDDIKSSLTNSYYLRLKDAPASVANSDDAFRFSPNNDYDCLVFYRNHLFCLELKSTQSTSISFARNKKEKGKMIKTHQLDGLNRAAEYSDKQNITAGLLLDYRGSGKTYFITIENFNRFSSALDTKHSINERDIMQYGGIQIDKELKRVHYDYKVEALFDKLIKSKESERNGE